MVNVLYNVFNNLIMIKVIKATNCTIQFVLKMISTILIISDYDIV